MGAGAGGALGAESGGVSGRGAWASGSGALGGASASGSGIGVVTSASRAAGGEGRGGWCTIEPLVLCDASPYILGAVSSAPSACAAGGEGRDRRT